MDTPPKKNTYPYIVVSYADTPEVNKNYSVNDTVIKLRPFVATDYANAFTSFAALGIDGVAAAGSTVKIEIKHGTTLVQSASKKVGESLLFTFPNYQAGDLYQSYDHLQESNYQFNDFFKTKFETGKLYEVYATTTKNGTTGTVKTTSFQLYEVKRFDLLRNIATYYGISLETLKADNNLIDELVREGNILFIRDPKRNGGTELPQENLDDETKQLIYEYLRGRNQENEYAFGPVNLNTGNYVLQQEDFKFKVGTEEYTFTRSYNSYASTDMSSLGWGWKHNYEYRLFLLENEIAVELADGKRVTFRLVNGEYKCDTNLDYKLVKTADGYNLNARFSKYVFDKSGKIIKVETYKKEVTEFFYTNGFLTKIKFHSGQEIILEYNYEKGLLTKVTKFDGSVIRYQYDDEGRLIKVIDEIGEFRTFEYDEKNLLTIVWNKEGNQESQNFYDERNRVYKIIDAEGKEKNIEYYGTYTVEVDAKGNRREVHFDENRQTEKIIEADGTILTRRYDMGWLKQTTESGVVYYYSYDYKGNLLERKREDGLLETYVYDSNNNLLSKTDMLGNVTKFQYNTNNNLIKETDPMGNVTTYEYRGQISNTYPEVNYWVNKTGSVFKANTNAATVTMTNYAKPIIVSKVRLTAEAIWRGDWTETAYVAVYGKTESGDWIWLGQSNLQVICDGRTNKLDVVLNISNKTPVTAIRYQITAASYVTVKITTNSQVTAWQEMQPKTCDPNASTVNGCCVCNAGYIGNGIKCDQLLSDDVVNQLIKKTDPMGNVTTYEYDTQGFQNKINYPDGTSDSYVYNANGEVVSHTNRQGYTTSYTRNDRGDVIVQTNADGSTVKYEYNEDGYPIKIQNELGYNTVYEYDKNNNLIKETDPRGNSVVYEYDANDNQTKVTYSNMDKEEYEYDEKDRLIYKQVNGIETRYEYSEYGVIREYGGIVDTKYTYDNLGRVKEIEYIDGLTEQFVYDLVGKILRKTDVLGNTTSFSYDKNENLLEEKTDLVKTTYQYNKNNQVTKKVSEYTSMNTQAVSFDFELPGEEGPGGGGDGGIIGSDTPDQTTIDYAYDSSGRLIKETIQEKRSNNTSGATTQIISYQYSKDQLVKEIDPLVYTKQYTYNNRGLVSKIIYSDGTSDSYLYDASGKLVEETNRVGATTKKQYDSNGNLILVTNALGNQNSYVYDVRNRLVKEISPLGYTVEYIYDSRGNKITTKTNGIIVESYEYDENNLPKKVYDIHNQYVTFEYDLFGKVIKETSSIGTVKEYTYNQNQLLMQVKQDKTVWAKYTYDKYGQVITEQDQRGNTYTYTYNSHGELIEKNNIKGFFKEYFEYSETTQKYSHTLNFSSTSIYDLNGNLINYLEEDLYYSLSKEYSYVYDPNGYVIEERLIKFGANEQDIVTTYQYDAYGNVLKETNALGVMTRYEYDKLGNLIKKFNPDGGIEQYFYNADGLLIKSINPLGGVVQYAYDANRNLIKQTNERGYVTTNTYDSKNQLVTVKDSLGGTTKYRYDKYGRLVAETNSLNNTKEYSYDKYNRITIITYEDGSMEQMGYNSYGDIIKKTDKLEFVMRYTYDNFGNLIFTRDENGNMYSTYKYDVLGRLDYEIGKHNVKTTYTHDAFGNIASELVYDGSGNFMYITDYKYNKDNSLKWSSLEFTGNKIVTEITYDKLGNLLTSTNKYISYPTSTSIDNSIKERVEIQSYEYDSMGNIINSTDIHGTESFYTYDLNQNLLEVRDIKNNSTKYAYDLSGNLIELENAIDAKTTYVYDALNRLTQEKNGMGYYKTYQYDSLGQLILVQDEKGAQTTYQYDKVGNVVFESFENRTILTSYNFNKQPVKIQYYDDTVEKYEYDLKGNLVKKTNKDGTIVVYEYDVWNQLTKESIGEKETDYIYDAMGNLISAKNSSFQSLLTYNAINQLTSYTTNGNKVSYEYSGSLVSTITDSNRNIIYYTYNDKAQLMLVEEKDNTGNIKILSSYQYDELNQLAVEYSGVFYYSEFNEHMEKGAGIKTTYSYTPLGQISSINNYSEGVNYYYNYDLLGNMINESQTSGNIFLYDENWTEEDIWFCAEYFNQLTDYTYFETEDLFGQLIELNHEERENALLYLSSFVGGQLNKISYVYNERNELVKETTRDTEGIIEEIEYGYNIHGDRVEITNGKEISSYEYNEQGKLIKYNNGIDTIVYTYNVDGSLKQEVKNNSEVKKYQYNEYGQLSGVKDYDGTELFSWYDPLGNKIVELYRKNVIIQEYINYVNDINREYTEVLTMVKGGTTYNFRYGHNRISINEYSYVYDGKGNVHSLAIDDGYGYSKYVEYSYDSYGKRNETILYSVKEAEINPFGYRGEAHTEVGLQYLRARYYNPEIGRFIQMDTYFGSMTNPISQNRYTYVHNNPNMYSDPSGHKVSMGGMAGINKPPILVPPKPLLPNNNKPNLNLESEKVNEIINNNSANNNWWDSGSIILPTADDFKEKLEEYKNKLKEENKLDFGLIGTDIIDLDGENIGLTYLDYQKITTKEEANTKLDKFEEAKSILTNTSDFTESTVDFYNSYQLTKPINSKLFNKVSYLTALYEIAKVGINTYKETNDINQVVVEVFKQIPKEITKFALGTATTGMQVVALYSGNVEGYLILQNGRETVDNYVEVGYDKYYDIVDTYGFGVNFPQEGMAFMGYNINSYMYIENAKKEKTKQKRNSLYDCFDQNGAMLK